VVEAEQDPAIATPLKYAQIGIKNIIKIAQNTGLIINHN
jgi:hypothetical protein